MEKFDIYDLDFIYQEDKLKENPRTKNRPVLILGNDILIPVVKITGTERSDPKVYKINKWKEAGLDKPSYIDFGRQELVKKAFIESNGKFRGKLSDIDIQNIKSKKFTEGLIETAKPTYTFSYKGPVYRFNKIYTVLKEPIYVIADNINHAYTLLTGKLKKQNNFSYNSNLTIDKDDIIQVTSDPFDYEVIEYNPIKKEQHKESDYIGSINNHDIYFENGYYKIDDLPIKFISEEDIRDYLEESYMNLTEKMLTEDSSTYTVFFCESDSDGNPTKFDNYHIVAESDDEALRKAMGTLVGEDEEDEAAVIDTLSTYGYSLDADGIREYLENIALTSIYGIIYGIKDSNGNLILDNNFDYYNRIYNGESPVKESLSYSQIIEKLNEIDRRCIDEDLKFYDVKTLFEDISTKLTPQDKEEIKKIIQTTDDAETIAAVINSKTKKESLDEDTEGLDISEYTQLSSSIRDGGDVYALFRKVEDGKGKWAAAKYVDGSPDIDNAFEITYEQARGQAPLSRIGEVSRELGKKLLPKNEALEDDVPYTYEQMEKELKSATNSWTKDNFEGWVGFVDEFNSAMDILSHHYENVEKLGHNHAGHGFIATRPSVYENLNEASYGGAYDIDDEMYFTKDDIVDFVDLVVERLEKEFNKTYQITDLGFNDPTHLYIELEDAEGYSFEYELVIDMRKIRKPRDIYKYADLVTDYFKNRFKLEYDFEETVPGNYNESLNESVSRLNNKEKQIYIDALKEAEDREDLEDIVHEIFFYDRGLFVLLRHFPKDMSFEDLRDKLIEIIQSTILDESLNEKLVDVSDDLQKEFEQLFDKNGWKIEAKGNTWMGDIHYQIISTGHPIEEKDLKNYADSLIKDIDVFSKKYDIPVTWNFGLNNEYMPTAGVDIYKQYVEESLNEDFNIIADNYAPGDYDKEWAIDDINSVHVNINDVVEYHVNEDADYFILTFKDGTKKAWYIHSGRYIPDDEYIDESLNEKQELNEDKIADKITSKQDTKEMTKRAIKMLKNLGSEYKDLEKEYERTYKEKPLNESATSNLRDKIIDCLDWFILMEMEFPKDQFLADSWEDLKDGIEMGLDPEFETAEGIVEYLKPIISFNKHYTKEVEDEGVFQDEIDMYRSLIRAMNIYLKDQGYDDTVKE